jgi:predicted site-specific integrase-resolvase
MVIKISDVQERWNISRPTVMKALKNGKLSGSKNDSGRWEFEESEVIRWRGEPKTNDWVSINDLPPPQSSDQSALVEALQKQVEQLSEQVQVKDSQMEKLQEQMRDQTKLLEHQNEQQNKGWVKRLLGN